MSRIEPADNEAIAITLCELGLDAWPQDGWVYVGLADDQALCISAEYGASLSAWFGKRPAPPAGAGSG